VELGTKVSFKQIAKKTTGYIDYDHLTDEQANQLDEHDFIDLQRMEIVDLKRPLTGLVMGKRIMAKVTTLIYYDTEYGPSGLRPHETKNIDVYIVATSMNKSYKVPVELVEIVE
jgi:hypothetical protein